MATSLPIIRYELDTTGTNPDNAVHGEIHNLISGRPVRAIATQYGSYFTDSLVVINTLTSAILTPNVDYRVAELNQSASALYAKEICTVVLITNATLSQVSIDYQALGGPYERNSQSLVDVMNNLLVDNRPVAWPDIIGKPDRFTPSMHLHDIGDTYGWEFICDALERIRQAILLADAPAMESVLVYVDTKIEETRTEFMSGSGALDSHINDHNNPHAVTKTQVGLSYLQNLEALTDVQMTGFTATQPSSNQPGSLLSPNRYVTTKGLMAYHDAILAQSTIVDNATNASIAGLNVNINNLSANKQDSLRKRDGTPLPSGSLMYTDASEMVSGKLGNQIAVDDHQLFFGYDVYEATNYYINDVAGSNSNAGTRASPFQTVEHALSLLLQGKRYVIWLAETQTFNVRNDIVIKGNYIDFRPYGTNTDALLSSNKSIKDNVEYKSLDTRLNFVTIKYDEHYPGPSDPLVSFQRPINVTSSTPYHLNFYGLKIELFGTEGSTAYVKNYYNHLFIPDPSQSSSFNVFSCEIAFTATGVYNFSMPDGTIAVMSAFYLVQTSSNNKSYNSLNLHNTYLPVGYSYSGKHVLFVQPAINTEINITCKPDGTNMLDYNPRVYMPCLSINEESFYYILTEDNYSNEFRSIRSVNTKTSFGFGVRNKHLPVNSIVVNTNTSAITTPNMGSMNFEVGDVFRLTTKPSVDNVNNSTFSHIVNCLPNERLFTITRKPDLSSPDSVYFNQHHCPIVNPDGDSLRTMMNIAPYTGDGSVQVGDYLTTGKISIEKVCNARDADPYLGRSPVIFSLVPAGNPGVTTELAPTLSLAFDTTYYTGLTINNVNRPLAIVFYSKHNLNAPGIRYRPMGTASPWNIIMQQAEQGFNGLIMKTISFIVPVGYEFQLFAVNAGYEDHQCLIYL